MSKTMQIDIRILPFYEKPFEKTYPKMARLMRRLSFQRLIEEEVSLYALVDVMAGITRDKSVPSDIREVLGPHVEKMQRLKEKASASLLARNLNALDQWLYDIEDVFDDLEKCGVNAIHPIEPKAMDIREVKQKVGDRFCLCGNVDVDLLARGSVKQVKDYVKMLLNQVALHGGYCLGSGNSVPEYVNIDNYRTMVQLTKQFGYYPVEFR